MKLLGLKILLEHMHYLDLILPEEEAVKILRTYDTTGIIGGTTAAVPAPYNHEPVTWRVETKRIVGVHTFNAAKFMENIKVQQEVQDKQLFQQFGIVRGGQQPPQLQAPNNINWRSG